MNSQFKHPILKALPSDIKKEPTLESIQQWLYKKRKRFKTFAILMTILLMFYLIYLLSDVLRTKHVATWDKVVSYSHIVSFFVFLSVVTTCISMMKKYALSDEEIKKELELCNRDE